MKKKQGQDAGTEREKHWSLVEYLHETVKNPNIIINGTRSYYSDVWTGGFERSVVRYLYGDEYSLAHWQPQWELDRLVVGNYVCIGGEAVILLGGNNTHRSDWFSNYPFEKHIPASYRKKGDTVIGNGVWIGMRAMIMPGVQIGEGAVIGANSVVTRNVEPYAVVGGNPAKQLKYRFEPQIISRLLELRIYELPENQTDALQDYLCSDDIDSLEKAVKKARSGL